MERKLYSKKDIELFSRPLIIGASISAGFGTTNGGPASVLSKMINPDAKITNLARNGYTSIQSTAHLNVDKYDPSIILGLDMFFWDTARDQVGDKFEKNTRKFFAAIHEKKIPMIVGKLPVVEFPIPRIASYIKSAAKVNALLEELCTLDNNTLLYDPLECFLQMDPDEHFSDMLHLTCEGNNFCANFLAKSGEFKKLKYPHQFEVAS